MASIPAFVDGTIAHQADLAFALQRPYCLAYQVTPQTLTTAVSTAITLDGETEDTDAMHSTVTNASRLTVVTAGVFFLVGQVGYASNNTGFRRASISKNGSLTPLQQLPAAPSGTTYLQVSGWDRAIVGDYYELGAHQTSGGNLATLAGAAVTWMAAIWVRS